MHKAWSVRDIQLLVEKVLGLSSSKWPGAGEHKNKASQPAWKDSTSFHYRLADHDSWANAGSPVRNAASIIYCDHLLTLRGEIAALSAEQQVDHSTILTGLEMQGYSLQPEHSSDAHTLE